MSKTRQKTVGSFRAIIPDDFKVDAVYKTLKTELAKFGDIYLKPRGEMTTRFWKTPLKWTVKVDVNSSRWKLTLIMKGPGELITRWRYVDEGTRPHIIRPRRAKRLRFQSGYSAGSSAGQLFTSRGGASGATVFRPYVKHPGTKARNWSRVIARETEKPLTSWMEAAMKKAARDSGHAYEGMR